MNDNYFLDAIDVGFNAVKGASANGRECEFLSVIGTHREGTYSDNSSNQFVIDGYDVGIDAIEQSDYQSSRRDPRWVFSDTWRVLLCAALAKLHPDTDGYVKLVTGLPLAHYRDIAQDLKHELLNLELSFTVNGVFRQFQIIDVFVITQPFGTLYNYALGDIGQVISSASATKMVGVVDIGGETLNLLAAHKLREVAQWTSGDGLGLLNALDAIAHALHRKHDGFYPKAREVALWVAAGEYEYFGKSHDITEIANRELDTLVSFIVDRINAVFKEPGRLAGLCVTGGGAMILGERIKTQLGDRFPAVVLGDNRSNVRGYLKVGRRKWKK